MRTWSFVKGHGTRNDFVVLKDRSAMMRLTQADVRFLCDRRGGIGGDGVLRAVKAVWPADRPLFCRVPAHDGHPDGLSGDNILAIAGMLGELGVDMIDVAASNVSPDCRVVTAADMQRVSTEIRETLGIATTTAGGGDPDQANDLLDGGKLDLVAVGRPLLTNPYWLLSHADGEQREMPRLREDAAGHFALDHDDELRRLVRRFEEVANDRAAGEVRQVADTAVRRPRPHQLRGVDDASVALHDL